MLLYAYTLMYMYILLNLNNKNYSLVYNTIFGVILW